MSVSVVWHLLMSWADYPLLVSACAQGKTNTPVTPKVPTHEHLCGVAPAHAAHILDKLSPLVSACARGKTNTPVAPKVPTNEGTYLWWSQPLHMEWFSAFA